VLPLRTEEPAVFVLPDLFDPPEGVAYKAAFIDRVYAVMALCPQHTFQLATRNAERMKTYLTSQRWIAGVWEATDALFYRSALGLVWGRVLDARERMRGGVAHVWHGVKVACDGDFRRVLPLARCPSAVRYIEVVPFGPEMDVSAWLGHDVTGYLCCGAEMCECASCALASQWPYDSEGLQRVRIDWVIASGGDEPCDIAWFRALRDECAEAGVPVFVKQLGARPCDASLGVPVVPGEHIHNAEQGHIAGNGVRIELADAKGGDPSEWPADLRVREMPRAGGSA
jgi:protein gp37